MTPEVSQCAFNRFQTHYAPFQIPEQHMSVIVSKFLERGDMVTESEDGHIFEAYAKPLPPTESAAYSPLEEIIKAVADAASKVSGFASTRSQTYVYKPCSHITISSDIPVSDHLVDAVFEKRCMCGLEQIHEISKHRDDESKLSISTRNSASVCEFTTRATDSLKLDNAGKVLSATVHIMDDDPCRMFSYAFTIESYSVRLWYFCRSHSVVSEPLYLNEPGHFKRLIAIFVSFLFATAEEMGYDPTVTAHELDGETQYTYTIPKSPTQPSDRFFRTVRTIDDYRTINITGRRTRVWLVEERKSAEENAPTVDGQTPVRYVLKDVWLEAASKTEKEIQDSIFEGIKEFLGNSSLPPEKAGLAELQQKHAHLKEDDAFKRYFMTIVADYQGRETPFYDKYLMQSASRIFTTPRPNSRFSAKSGRQNTSTPRDFDARTQEVARKFATKRQYRVVFKEVCQDVGKLEKLGDVMDVLGETLIPLQLMHCAGYVHRDISSGNILAYKADPNQRHWQAKLSDLEYAKQFPPTTGRAESKDPKTGTPYFMAHEILKKVYFTAPTKEVEKRAQELGISPQEETDAIDAELDEYRKQQDSASGANRSKSPSDQDSDYTVVHNPQHDIESLWWLGLWTLTMRVDHAPSREWAKHIFRNTLDPSAARSAAFTKPIMFKLHDHLRPNLLNPFANIIERLRRRLFNSYWTRETADHVLDLNSYRDIYPYVDRIFEVLRNDPSEWREQDLKDPPANIDSDLDPHGVKRARSMPNHSTGNLGEASSAARPTSSKRLRGG
ncbi:hypothetical protein CPC08DRAFT_716367 [Agrocybe pediades]|nr:hypothetical protein CPC08DRAFT_717446 [Agrocybe pediades]KAF9544844.1 hypothetical protein CPC08DRAFT_716367 [Agrocybe pediades]